MALPAFLDGAVTVGMNVAAQAQNFGPIRIPAGKSWGHAQLVSGDKTGELAWVLSIVFAVALMVVMFLPLVYAANKYKPAKAAPATPGAARTGAAATSSAAPAAPKAAVAPKATGEQPDPPAPPSV